jgi:hypothetical protein
VRHAEQVVRQCRSQGDLAKAPHRHQGNQLPYAAFVQGGEELEIPADAAGVAGLHQTMLAALRIRLVVWLIAGFVVYFGRRRATACAP